MSNIDKQALREVAKNAKELGCISRYTKVMGVRLELKEAVTPDAVLALLDELEAKDKQNANLLVENVRLKAGIAGLVSLGLRHGDIEVMRLAGDAQHSTPCTDSIIEKIAAGTSKRE